MYARSAAARLVGSSSCSLPDACVMCACVCAYVTEREILVAALELRSSLHCRVTEWDRERVLRDDRCVCRVCTAWSVIYRERRVRGG